MSKCKKCQKAIEYMTYHCSKCRKELAGTRPKKSKTLCSGCRQNWYNQNREKGCLSYKTSKVIIKDVYFSLNQVIPNPKWKLNCFLKEY